MRKATDKPNIILINCDDLGYGDLSCYGSRLNNTPTIDYLATNGIMLTDFYMPAPVCSPSRAGMLTGCYPRRISMDVYGEDKRIVLFPGDPEGLHQSEITIADILKRNGYVTKLVGKWHLGDQPPFLPTRHGFDEFYGLPYSNDMGMIIQYPAYPPLPLMCQEEVIEQQPDQATLTERYVEECVKFIRKYKSEPFFLYLAHMYVHIPLFVPEHFLINSQNGQYGAAVEYIDWATSVIIYELRKAGIENNTILIFTSDNGSTGKKGGSNFPLRGGKGTTWEGGMRVPCIFYWPGVIPAGNKYSGVVTGMDFLPTICALTGSKVPDDRKIDGHDISCILKGELKTRSPYKAFFYYKKDMLEAVRSEKWKLNLCTEELFDLEKNPEETVDVSKGNSLIVSELLKLADTIREDIGDALQNAEGANRRPCGYVENPKTLTYYEKDYPYIVAMYDINGSPRPRSEMYAQPPEKFNKSIIGPQKY